MYKHIFAANKKTLRPLFTYLRSLKKRAKRI